MFCSKCGTQVDDGADFCSKCGQLLTGNKPASFIRQNSGIKMETKNIILKGDTSKSKALVRYMPALIILCTSGLLFLIFSVPMMAGVRKAEEFGGVLVLLLFGGIFILGGIALPIGAAVEAKKWFIDVYEDGISGAYFERYKGYIPFTLTYDKIESVFAKKTKVYVQLAGQTICCKAFNASEIAMAISSRLSRYN